MENNFKEIDQITQNLKDAGCKQSLIEQFFCLQQDSKIYEQMQLLESHRNVLLTTIHKNQKRIDCLDFLICKMSKQSLKRQQF